MTKTFIYFCLFLVSVSCSNKYPADVEQALKYAGKNRAELEKVLDYYSQHPEDSLKYRAACFLIENMPQHFYYESALIDTFKTFKRLAESKQISLDESYDELVNRHGRFSYHNAKKVYDMHVITSDFLISNIDLAFRVWQEMPYGKHYGFRDFCELILPYRVMDERLENWRELYYQTFKPIVDTVSCPEDPVFVAQIVNDYVINRKFKSFTEKPVPEFGPVTLWNEFFGGCREMAVITAYFLRSIGIPSSVDMVLKRPDMVGEQHYMCSLLDSNRRSNLFEPLDYYYKLEFPGKKFGKLYRASYSLKKESLPFVAPKGTFIPPSLSNSLFLKDVTAEYIEKNAITVDLQKQGTASPGGWFCFLSVFDISRWTPVDWSLSDNEKATFQNVQNENLYRVMIHDGENLVPASQPFILSCDSVRFIKPDYKNLINLNVERKYRFHAFASLQMERLVGGKFEVANKEDFSDAVLLWRINDFNRYCFHYADFTPNGKKYRYFRYVSPEGARGFMGEMEAFDRDGKRIEATRVFGSEEWEGHLLEHIYDGNQLTYYAAPLDVLCSVWAAVDFGEPREIASIRYICCNDDNSIRVGDEYQMFYWDEVWYSLGRRTGDKSHLFIFENAPSNTLYLLRNYSRGREERPFIYENGKQLFY